MQIHIDKSVYTHRDLDLDRTLHSHLQIVLQQPHSNRSNPAPVVSPAVNYDRLVRALHVNRNFYFQKPPFKTNWDNGIFSGPPSYPNMVTLIK